MNDLYPEDVPGFTQALDAVQVVGGVLLPPEAARQLVMVVAAVLRPHLTAELYADLADDEVVTAISQYAPELGLSTYFDNVSHGLRRSLDG